MTTLSTRGAAALAVLAILFLAVFQAAGSDEGALKPGVTSSMVTHVDYDLPSSVFARFKSKQINEVAKGLDQKLEKLITTALKN
jgi:hypothetical protein